MGIWKGGIFVEDIEELETMDASKSIQKRLNAKEVIFPKENGNFIFSVTDGTVKIFGRGQRLRTSTLTQDPLERGEEQEILRGNSYEWYTPSKLQEDSTRDDEEAKMISGRSQVSSSRCTKSQTARAERRIISCPVEVHRRQQNDSHIPGCTVGKTYWRLLERGWRKRIIRCMDRLHKIHLIERKAT